MTDINEEDIERLARVACLADSQNHESVLCGCKTPADCKSWRGRKFQAIVKAILAEQARIKEARREPADNRLSPRQFDEPVDERIRPMK